MFKGVAYQQLEQGSRPGRERGIWGLRVAQSIREGWEFLCRGARRSPDFWAASMELVDNQTPPKACLLCSSAWHRVLFPICASCRCDHRHYPHRRHYSTREGKAPEISPGCAGRGEGSQVPKIDPLVYLFSNSGESKKTSSVIQNKEPRTQVMYKWTMEKLMPRRKKCLAGATQQGRTGAYA